MTLPPESAQARRAALRDLLASEACLRPASVHDPLAARIATDLGFELAILAGSTASLTVLGAPDLILLTLSELAEQARRICRAGAPPLLVDADHGYGNALNVRRTVEELEQAGVAGLTIEDTDLPLPYGVATPRLISRGEGVGKIRAALSARIDPGLVIIARTSAVEILGLEEAVTRLRAYEAAGADALFIAGSYDREAVEAISEATTLPLILSTLPQGMTLEELAALRVRICLFGHLPIMAAAQAMMEVLQAQREGGRLPVEMPEGLAREALYKGWTREFLAR
ncbi:isocitrate lyase/PEP mutase family protein [Acetobacteraceae bacterium H6797]|nr:isocitrate lyase/PEP mutase family protein [Acetobacteraceae bacterium H6797]